MLCHSFSSHNSRLASVAIIFKAVSEATKPDIICIVETWLDSVITDDEVDFPDYQLFRLAVVGVEVALHKWQAKRKYFRSLNISIPKEF